MGGGRASFLGFPSRWRGNGMSLQHHIRRPSSVLGKQTNHSQLLARHTRNVKPTSFAVGPKAPDCRFPDSRTTSSQLLVWTRAVWTFGKLKAIGNSHNLSQGTVAGLIPLRPPLGKPEGQDCRGQQQKERTPTKVEPALGAQGSWGGLSLLRHPSVLFPLDHPLAQVEDHRGDVDREELLEGLERQVFRP